MAKIVTYVEVDTPAFNAASGRGDIAFADGTVYDFDTNSLFGWTASNATLTASANGAVHTTTATDPMLNSPAISIDGATHRYIAVDVERTAVRTSGAWAGEVYYQTSGHGQSGSFSNRFAELANTVGARRTYIIDMHDLFTGGDDWATNTITQLRLDFDQGTGGAFLIHSIKIGSYDQTWRFAEPTEFLDRSIECIPSIASVRYDAAVISLGENLGQRASLSVSFRDHKHIMDAEPFDSGTFWGKWRARYGQKLRGRPIRLLRGVAGQSLEEMESRWFFAESTDGPTPDGVYTIVAKDLLKFADDDRAQAPRLSNGRLAGSINDSVTAAVLSPTGIGNLEYPASGHICLGGKEIVAFTRSGDDLTITRGQLGTPQMAHNAGDRAQLVLYYDGDDVANIISDLLTTYGGIDPQYTPVTEWQAETAAHLGGVIYARPITEPTSVSKLVSELVQEAALAVWWDERARIVRLQVLKEIATDADLFDEETILEGSLKVKDQPNKRISQIWTYYGQRNPADRGDNEDNYRAAEANVDLQRQSEYGGPIIRKITGKWVATINAAQRLNQIQLSRFRDPPRKFDFDLFHATPIAAGSGYRLRWRQNQDITGAIVEEGAPIQVTKVAVEPGVVHVEAEEMLASGVIVITKTVFLTATGGVFEWQIPEDWNDSDNTIECIGAGGGGGRETSAFQPGGGKGAGAGAYSKITNLALSSSPPGTVQYRVGDGGLGANQPGNGSGTAGQDGGDIWFNGANFASASVAAKGGQAGSGRTGGGLGGQASEGIGDVKHSGGDGADGAPRGETRAGGGGGGGAAGPHGDGADGGDQTLVNQDGGSGGGAANSGQNGTPASAGTGGPGGKNRFNFGGGTAESPNGQESGGGRGGDSQQSNNGHGGPGEQLWTQTIAPIMAAGPGGGAGGGGSSQSGKNGGLYGGAGSGCGVGALQAGNGAPGIIVLTWRPAA